MKVTAKDLAEKLGISPSAVSLVLNDKPGVSAETRETVLAEATRMGYKFKHKVTKPSKQNVRYVIFLENGDTVKETSFYSVILRGIENRAAMLDYNVFINYFYADGDWREQIETISQNVQGIIILATEMEDQHIKKLMNMGLANLDIPVVLVDNATSLINLDCVVSDGFRGAYEATMYLFEHGFEDVGYLRSGSRIDNFEERESGLKKARKDWGIPKSKELQMIDVNIASEKAYEAMINWLNEGHKLMPAYFADNDIIAAACIRALKTKGYKVPRDVSIIGYDDMPICTMVDPTLTTIRVMKTQMGSAAMNILHNRITEPENLPEDSQGAMRLVISTKLVERESVNK